jgi:hypothetical protein
MLFLLVGKVELRNNFINGVVLPHDMIESNVCIGMLLVFWIAQ